MKVLRGTVFKLHRNFYAHQKHIYMLLETENSVRAKQLEQKLLRKLSNEYGLEDGGLNSSVLDLFDHGDIDAIYKYESIMTELMSVCLHPDVQKQMPDWVKPHIGKRLLKLIDFFKSLDWEKFHLYMAYIKIKETGNSMTAKDIEGFERYYLN